MRRETMQGMYLSCCQSTGGQVINYLTLFRYSVYYRTSDYDRLGYCHISILGLVKVSTICNYKNFTM